MSTLSPSANYYGLKIAIEPTGSALIYGVEAKFYLSFKNVMKWRKPHSGGGATPPL